MQVPVLPGSGLLKSEQEAGTLADGIGYPVLLKVTHPDCMTCPFGQASVVSWRPTV